MHLKNFPNYKYWENGKAAPVAPIRPGEAIVYDIKRRPTFYLNSVFHSVHFYFPRAALNALADGANAPRNVELHYKPAVAHSDPVLLGITETLLPTFLMLAVGHHVATRYGGMRLKEHRYRGGLTPNQERRAKELLSENLAGEVSLAVVASECNLSLSQFSRAFQKSVGAPPHRWVMSRRIALAKAMLRDDLIPLSQVALECGFWDQSNLWVATEG